MGSPGPLARYLIDDHRRLEALLARAVAHPGRLDGEAYEAFRAGLLRHIGIEEKIVLREAQRRRDGRPVERARRLRLEHSAIAALLVPSPTHAIVAELAGLLERHDAVEEGAGGVYEECEALAGDEADALARRAEAAPEVPAAAHFDGPGVMRTAAEAIARFTERDERRKA